MANVSFPPKNETYKPNGNWFWSFVIPVAMLLAMIGYLIFKCMGY